MTLEIILSKQVCDLKHRIETLEYLLDLKLPVDVTFNSGTNKAGTTVRTLALRIKAVNDAQEFIDTIGVDCAKQIKQILSEVI